MLRQIPLALVAAAFVLLASLVYVRFPIFPPGADTAVNSEPIQIVSTSPKIQIASSTISVHLADTEEERARGLSGLAGLAEDEAMLFVFDADGPHAFWMKDMRFAIDIVWISRDGTIVHIEENVGPETYPEVFVPRSEARYVVELSGGWVDRHNVTVGDIVRL